MDELKICYVASEVVPFAKTGGLADVAGALPVAVKELDQDIRVMMPKYKSINERKFVLREVIRLKEVPVEMGGQLLMATGKTAFLPDSKVHVYFLYTPNYFDQKDLYVDSETGKDFEDNAERFASFSKAVLETLKLLYWQPDIIHCNDWQTALIPFYLKTLHKDDEFFRNTRTVLTIHNLAYQGNFPLEKAQKVDIPPEYIAPGKELEFYGKLNFLKGGILFADVINTVSKKYAEEIVSDPEYSCGFDKILETRKADLHGILNGADYTNWNPETDNLITANYSKNELEKKVLNKKQLCKVNRLEFSEETPLIGMISRLADQKGFDLIAQAAEELLSLDLQLVILGTGDPRYHKLLEQLAKKFPKKLAINLRFDNKLAHLIEAGADMFLMPSKYEPCGLNQIYSLKYGTVPIVRETGGLADTVQNFDPKTGKGNGFTFKEYKVEAMIDAIKRALEVFQDKKTWRHLQETGMDADFSWQRSALEYIELYKKALQK
ncbi:MAG: glycogen synthase GlgA [Calditrichia bacterium]